MIPRRSVPVHEHGSVVSGERLVISASQNFGTEHPLDFVLHRGDGESIATCVSAKRLSDWAFENGAQEVRHDYDLRLSDGES